MERLSRHFAKGPKGSGTFEKPTSKAALLPAIPEHFRPKPVLWAAGRGESIFVNKLLLLRVCPLEQANATGGIDLTWWGGFRKEVENRVSRS
jgi:hypothetical protein